MGLGADKASDGGLSEAGSTAHREGRRLGAGLPGGDAGDGANEGLEGHWWLRAGDEQSLTYPFGLSTTGFLGRPPFLPLAFEEAAFFADLMEPSTDITIDRFVLRMS